MLNDTTHLISDAEVPITSIIFIVMLVLCSYMSSLTSVYLSHCMCRIFNSLRVIIFSGFKKKITTWQWSRLSSKSHTCWGRVLPLSYIVFVYIVYVVHCYIIYIYCIFFLFYIVYIIFSFPFIHYWSFNLPVSLACNQKYCSQHRMAVISLRTQFQFHQMYNQRIIE